MHAPNSILGPTVRHVFVAAVGLCLLLDWGCTSSKSAGGHLSADEQDASSVDPKRAFVRLDQLDAACVTVPEPQAESKPLSTRGRRRIDKANRLYAQQRYTEAGLELERALQTDPGNYTVHLELARTLRAGGSLDRCRTHLQRALELGPGDSTLHYLLARSALDDGDDGRAVCELRIALACPNITEKP
ncbi:MAG: tetratricopeptide repeat protein, partial [Phycisphaerae bacterium]